MSAADRMTRAKPDSLRPATVHVIVLVLVGLALFGLTRTNTALFHHVPNAYADPVLDNTMLKSQALWTKIFTGEFLLATGGEYRPAGYALFALVNRTLPSMGHEGWHFVLVSLHTLTALLLYLMLRTLATGRPALLLSVTYLVHPVFAPFLNDVNSVYLLWGLLWSALTLWLFLAHLKTGKRLPLVLSVVAFAAATFTFRHAALVPALLVALCLFHDTHPKGAAGMLVYVTLAGFIASLFQTPVLITLPVLCAVVLAIDVATSTRKDKYRSLIKLAPYAVVMAVFGAVSASITPRPLFARVLGELEKANLTVPFQPWFVARMMLERSALHVAGVVAVALVPVLLLLKPRLQRPARVAAFAILALLVGLQGYWSRAYRDDVRYWEQMKDTAPDTPAIDLNLATAYVDGGHWKKARNILMRLYCEPEVQELAFEMNVKSKLGKTFVGLGNDRLAGYYFFSTGHRGWHYLVMKNLLMDAADFSFRTGYLSTAENFWAAALVLDPYDVRLHVNLGKVLMYKNFFRAADIHLRHALQLTPDDVDALYYLAFIAHSGGYEQEYESYKNQWQAATQAGSDLRFQPIREAYRQYLPMRDRMREWFSDNPAQMFFKPPQYSVEYKGKTYHHWEVPLEIGKYFAETGRHAKALLYLTKAQELNPNSAEIMRRLADTYRQLNQSNEADRIELLPETSPNGN